MFYEIINKELITKHFDSVLFQICRLVKKCRTSSAYICKYKFHSILHFSKEVDGVFCIEDNDHRGCLVDTINIHTITSIKHSSLVNSIAYWINHLNNKLKSCIFNANTHIAQNPSNPCENKFNYSEFGRGIAIACLVFTGLYVLKFLVKRVRSYKTVKSIISGSNPTNHYELFCNENQQENETKEKIGETLFKNTKVEDRCIIDTKKNNSICVEECQAILSSFNSQSKYRRMR